MLMIRRMRSTLGLLIGVALVGGTFVLSAANAPRMAFRRQGPPAPSISPQGQTTTQLSDGRWLIVGGEGAPGTSSHVAVFDPLTGITTPLGGSLVVPRAWHTATV